MPKRWNPYCQYRTNLTEQQWNEATLERRRELWGLSTSGQPSAKTAEPGNSEEVLESIKQSYSRLNVRIVTKAELDSWPTFRM